MAVLGNGCVVYLIVARSKLHTTANWFILSLALADCFVGLSYFPLLFASDFDQDMTIDHTGAWFKISHSFLYCSSANLCVMTADRFLVISKPLKYAVLMTRRRRMLVLTAAWTAPLLLFTVPSIFTYSRGTEELTFVFETSRVLIFQLVPSVVFLFVTVRLCVVSRDISRKESKMRAQVDFNQRSLNDVKHKHNLPERKASVKIVISIISLFIFCHIGGNYRCFCFVFTICTVPETFKKAIHLLFVLNSAANPVAYAVFKKDIKKELRRWF